MRQKNILGQLLLRFSLLGSLVLPACVGSDPAALTASPSPETAMARPAATMAATTRPLLEPTPGLNPAAQATTIAGPTAETAAAPASPAAAEISTELKATAPSEVVLASGRLQLIEFFAFW